MPPVRLIIHEPAPGPWNMGVDEMLLLRAAAGAAPTLRLYQWSEPTLSLGYFQRWADRAGHSASGDCTAVRRVTGGGAIVHHRELTYSFTMPVRDRLRQVPGELYARFHGSLIELLATRGLTARLCTEVMPREQAETIFLCFQRRAAGDLLVGAEKVCGSAQRRHRSGLLQHGSLLLARSPQAPELPGLTELGGAESGAEELIAAWLELLAEKFGWEFERSPLTREERAEAETIAREKFAQPAWTERH